MADAPGNLHALEDAAYTRALRDLPQPETSLLMPSQKSCLELRRLYPDYRPPTVHDLERRGGSSAPLAKYMWKAFIADRLKNLEAMGDDGIDPANVKLGVADESHDVRFATPPLSARTRTCLLSVRRKAYAAGVDGRRWATLTRHAPPRTAAGDGGRSSGSRCYEPPFFTSATHMSFTHPRPPRPPLRISCRPRPPPPARAPPSSDLTGRLVRLFGGRHRRRIGWHGAERRVREP